MTFLLQWIDAFLFSLAAILAVVFTRYLIVSI